VQAKQARLSTPSSDSGQFAPKSEDIFRLLSARDQYLFDDCEQRLLFLRSYLEPSNLVPFHVRFVRLSDELALVCLSELPSTFLTYHVHSLLGILNAVQYHPQELRCFHTLKQLETSTQKLLQYTQRLAERNTNDSRRQLLCRSLANRLNALTSSPLKKHILSFEQKPLSSQLEALCGAAGRCLREVLEQLVYVYHQQQLQQIEQQVLDHLSVLKRDTMLVIKDYSEFLLVKCSRNVAIESYSPFIPNLACFVFVDRSVNEFVSACVDDENGNVCWHDWHNSSTLKNSPSVARTHDACDAHLPTDLYAHVMSHLISRSYASLASGQLFCRWAEGSHLYNYCIWFEDHAVSELFI
jgi:hypothetical protein